MYANAFVTAEDTQSPKRGIWVLLETFSVSVEGEPTPCAFVITTSTGYRAELPACMNEMHDEHFGNCTKGFHQNEAYVRLPGSCSKTTWRTHCHGYHLKRAEAFRDAILDTYR